MIGCKRRLAVGWTINDIYKWRWEIFVVEEVDALFGALAIEIGKGANRPFPLFGGSSGVEPALPLKHLVRGFLRGAVKVAED
jgi:hypothetical protein